MRDVRWYPHTGAIHNNTHQGLPSILGHAAPTGTGWVYITHAHSQAQAGTTDTLDRAIDEVLDTWLNQQAVAS